LRICHQRATYSGSRNAGAPTVLPILASQSALSYESMGFLLCIKTLISGFA